MFTTTFKTISRVHLRPASMLKKFPIAPGVIGILVLLAGLLFLPVRTGARPGLTDQSTLATATATSGASTDFPLVFDTEILGALTPDAIAFTYSTVMSDVYSGDFDGTLVATVQSNDFFAHLDTHVETPGIQGGGGGWGCGDCPVGGSPWIKANVVHAQVGDKVLVTVTSMSGQETGNFTLAVYKTKRTSITSGRPYHDFLSDKHPVLDYAVTASLGDSLNASLEGGSLRHVQLSLVDSFGRADDYMALSADPRPQIRNYYVYASGEYSFLILSGVHGERGPVTLTITQKHPQSLDVGSRILHLVDREVVAKLGQPPLDAVVFHAAASEKVQLMANVIAGNHIIDLNIIPVRSDQAPEVVEQPLVKLKLAHALTESFQLPATGLYAVQAEAEYVGYPITEDIRLTLTHHIP